MKKFKNKGLSFRVDDDVYIKDNGQKYWGSVVKVGKKKIHCTFGTDEPQKFKPKFLKIVR